MPFSNEHYDQEMLAILTQAFNGAWAEVQDSAVAQDEIRSTRNLIALKIMDAASEGIHEVGMLRLIAIRAVDGRGSI
jgi:hypothetical protein